MAAGASPAPHRSSSQAPGPAAQHPRAPHRLSSSALRLSGTFWRAAGLTAATICSCRTPSAPSRATYSAAAVGEAAGACFGMALPSGTHQARSCGTARLTAWGGACSCIQGAARSGRGRPAQRTSAQLPDLVRPAALLQPRPRQLLQLVPRAAEDQLQVAASKGGRLGSGRQVPSGRAGGGGGGGGRLHGWGASAALTLLMEHGCGRAAAREGGRAGAASERGPQSPPRRRLAFLSTVSSTESRLFDPLDMGGTASPRLQSAKRWVDACRSEEPSLERSASFGWGGGRWIGCKCRRQQCARHAAPRHAAPPPPCQSAAAPTQCAARLRWFITRHVLDATRPAAGLGGCAATASTCRTRQPPPTGRPR